MTRTAALLALLAALAGAPAATAQAVLVAPTEATVVRHGDLEIVSPWSRGTNRPGQKISAAYFVLRNKGEQPVSLVSATTPAAGQVVFHDMVLKNGFPQMVTRDGPIVVPPGGEMELKPGGTHLMLTGLAGQLKPGTVFPLTLTFDDGSSVEVTTVVWDAGIVRAGEPPR